MQTDKNHIKIVTNNKKASFNYFLDEFFECGLVLTGTEIKSIRNHNPSLSDSYALIRNGEAFLINMNIPVYDKGNIFNHEPLRQRKLLLHKDEIKRLKRKVEEKGFTLIPFCIKRRFISEVLSLSNEEYEECRSKGIIW